MPNESTTPKDQTTVTPDPESAIAAAAAAAAAATAATAATAASVGSAATAVVDNASKVATRAPITTIDQIPQALRTQIEMGHKKGLQAELATAQEQLTTLNALRENVSGFMEMLGGSVTLTEGSDLGDVAAQITGTLTTLQTDKEKAEAATLKQSELLAIAQKQAATNLASLHDTLIYNDLTTEIMGNDKATSKMTGKCIADALRKLAKIGDDNKVVYEMEITDENGHTANQKIDVKTAVNQLEKDSEWKDFFKSTVNSGAGGDAAVDVKRTNDGTPDLVAMAATPEGVKKFMEIMETNPGLINDAYHAAK